MFIVYVKQTMYYYLCSYSVILECFSGLIESLCLPVSDLFGSDNKVVLVLLWLLIRASLENHASAAA